MSDDLLDHPLIGGRYFFAHGWVVDDPCTRLVTTRDGEVLRCLDVGPRDAPCVVHFHGNGEVVRDHLGLARWLEARGIRTVLAEYRGYLGSTGEPALGAMLGDVEDVLTACDVDPTRTVAFGRSVGSIFAIEAARIRPALAGLVLESGIADVLERLLLRVTPQELGCSAEALRAEVERRCDHEGVLGGFQQPVLVLHTQLDSLVDVSHGVRLTRWARHGEATIFERGDHNTIFMANEAAYHEALGGFLDRVLG